MSAQPTDLPRRTKTLSARERMECLLQAQLNDERAAMCDDRPALKAFFQVNAALFRKVAS